MRHRLNRRRFLKQSASTLLAASAWPAPTPAAKPPLQFRPRVARLRRQCRRNKIFAARPDQSRQCGQAEGCMDVSYRGQPAQARHDHRVQSPGGPRRDVHHHLAIEALRAGGGYRQTSLAIRSVRRHGRGHAARSESWRGVLGRRQRPANLFRRARPPVRG